MDNFKIRAFVLPKWDNNTMNAEDFDSGGYFIGEGTNEPILNIDFLNKKVTTRITTIASVMSFGYYESRQEYDFEDLEILSYNIERTKLNGNQVKRLVREAKASSDLQWEQINGYKSKSRFKW
jgi:hypothetical protein